MRLRPVGGSSLYITLPRAAQIFIKQEVSERNLISSSEDDMKNPRRRRHFNGGHMNEFFGLILVLNVSGALHAAEPGRFITKVILPSGQTAVVAEGDFEARSIGSFSVRLYDAAPPGDETTFFRAGHIRARDGTIEKVVLADVVDDQLPEIVVIVRSAGTGGYLSAHAFAFDTQRLTFAAVVEGLPPDADPIAALRQSNRKQN
jgi:Periplasmic lysozyme inhibitor of I-type lysozyme